MSWDASLPSNSTKIRNYPTVIPDNWQAIEEGNISLKHWQVNFIERNAVPGAPPPANDPTRADDTMILYSKQDGSGNTEMFVLDDNNPANAIQWTENGAIGSANTPLSASSITFDGGTTSFGGASQVAWAKVSSLGTISTQSGGLTCTPLATGRYTIGFSTGPATSTFVGMACSSAPTVPVNVSVENYTPTTLEVKITTASGGAAINQPFQVLVIGGR